MSWFLFALICLLGWGFADLFYKKSNVDGDRYSHLKTAVWVGLIMGVTAFCFMPFTETKFDFISLITNAAKYSPASLSYIISMVIGYAGLRYLELSIVSPVQNASGALSAIVMLAYFSIIGSLRSFWRQFTALDVIGTAVIVIGVLALAFVERSLAKKEGALDLPKSERKYRFGALALLFPILYCVFDTIGTAADGIILEGESGLDLGEIDVIVLYGLTFMLAGIAVWIFLWIKEKKPYNPFNRRDLKTNLPAAIFEQFGQIFYVYAMAQNAVLAAPMVASYCIISIILSRVFLKEKLKVGQYLCVFAVIGGIVLLGVSDGVKENYAGYTDPVVALAEASYEYEGDYAKLVREIEEDEDNEDYADLKEYIGMIDADAFRGLYSGMNGEVEIEADFPRIDGDNAKVTYYVTDEDGEELSFTAELQKDGEDLTVVSVAPAAQQ